MYKVTLQYRNSQNGEMYNRLFAVMPVVGDCIRLSMDTKEGYQFFFKTVKIVEITHTAFVEAYFNKYHESEPVAILTVIDICEPENDSFND